MLTAIVILNFNGQKHLETYLPSVIKHTENADIWVADNASTDQSIDYLKTAYPTVKIIQLPKNFGFAEGYNQALKQLSHYTYFVLLNSDVEVTNNWLPPLIERLQSADHIAVCQPKVRAYLQKEHFEYAGAAGGFLDILAYPYCRGRIFDSLEKDTGQYDSPSEIAWATGACMAIKTDAFLKNGGFDGRFFAHMEEIDLCWRLRNLGYSSFYEPKSLVYHLGGGTLHKSNPHKTFLNFRNGLALLFKNSPSMSLLWKIPARLILDGVAGIKFLTEGNVGDFKAILRAHFAFYAMIPYLIGRTKGIPSRNKSLTNRSIIIDYYLKGKKTFNQL